MTLIDCIHRKAVAGPTHAPGERHRADDNGEPAVRRRQCRPCHGHDAGRSAAGQVTIDPTTDTLSVAKMVIGGITFDGQNQLAGLSADHPTAWADSAGATTYFAATGGLEIRGTDIQMTANQRTMAVQFVIDGGGAAITRGLTASFVSRSPARSGAACLLSDKAGSIAVEIWKDAYANHLQLRPIPSRVGQTDHVLGHKVGEQDADRLYHQHRCRRHPRPERRRARAQQRAWRSCLRSR